MRSPVNILGFIRLDMCQYLYISACVILVVSLCPIVCSLPLSSPTSKLPPSLNLDLHTEDNEIKAGSEVDNGVKAGSKVNQVSPCIAVIDGKTFNLEPLQSMTGRPRFRHEDSGWLYTYNPCVSYNNPAHTISQSNHYSSPTDLQVREDQNYQQPNNGDIDQLDGCYHVAFCLSEAWASPGRPKRHYTLGLQRTAWIALTAYDPTSKSLPLVNIANNTRYSDYLAHLDTIDESSSSASSENEGTEEKINDNSKISDENKALEAGHVEELEQLAKNNQLKQDDYDNNIDDDNVLQDKASHSSTSIKKSRQIDVSDLDNNSQISSNVSELGDKHNNNSVILNVLASQNKDIEEDLNINSKSNDKNIGVKNWKSNEKFSNAQAKSNSGKNSANEEPKNFDEMEVSELHNDKYILNDSEETKMNINYKYHPAIYMGGLRYGARRRLYGAVVILVCDKTRKHPNDVLFTRLNTTSTKVRPLGSLTVRAGPVGGVGAGIETANQEQNKDIEIQFLIKYGYLENRTGIQPTDQEYREALMRYQAMKGMPVTGRMDNDTMVAMARPRCGVRDGPGALSSDPNDPLKFVLGPSMWDKNVISYRLKKDQSRQQLSPDTMDKDFRSALDLWQKVSNLRFVDADKPEGSSLVDENGKADIEASFEYYEHGDNDPLDGPGGTLAHAFPPGRGRGGDVHFDNTETWTSKEKRGTNFLIAAAHELGHSIGISHSAQKGSLMYPEYQGYVENYQLHSDDIMAIQHLYGSPAGSPRPEPPTMVPMQPETKPSVPGQLNVCGGLDAVATLRGDTFGFNGKWFWWLTREGQLHTSRIHDYWNGLPVSVERIDAAFERPENNVIIFFSGDRYYEFDGNNIRSEFRENGKPLTDLGISSNVRKIDAALVYGSTRRVFLVSGSLYWRVALENQLKVDIGYPVTFNKAWKDLPTPDAAFTNYKGQTYFIKGTQYWLLKSDQPQAEPGYPRSLRELWPHCAKQLSEINNASHLSSVTSLMTSFLFLASYYLCN